MALRVMSAIIPSSHHDSNPTLIDYTTIKEKLQEDLLAAAKICHTRFGAKSELATESDKCVTQLCCAFEKILSHGLRYSNQTEKFNAALRHVSELVSGISKSSDVPFWPFIRQLLTSHEQERFCVLRKVNSDNGRGRAWLRAALNERFLERHLNLIITSDLAKNYYEDWAFLLDSEKSLILPDVAAALTTILFAIRIDKDELNESLEDSKSALRSFASEPIITLPEPSTSNLKIKKKVPISHIITFDDDKENNLENTAIDSMVSSNLVSPALSENVSLDISDMSNKEAFEDKRLTPLTDSEMGELVPVSPIDDDMLNSLSNEDSQVTEAAEATEPLMASQESAEILTSYEILEQTREELVTSKIQLVRLQRQHQNYFEKHELQIQTLNRENELLRQQLRKYVTAVQMLKKDDSSSNEENCLDYHKESQQYQEKLVQVAEMHAELMEFNSKLTAQLNNKDHLIKMLQDELEYLRGPINEEDQPLESPCLIHIWIPSVFLTGQSSDIHHVYQIYVRVKDVEWNIYRRYAQFYKLYRDLKKNDSVMTTFEFPPKKTIGNKDAKFVEDRRQKLQQWLRRVLSRLAQCSPAFSSRPTKQSLISLLPFFGDLPNEIVKNNSTNTCSSSPQYMGL